MKIQFKIPNGRMCINTETFFRGANISKIRKMLKLWKNSGPEAKAVEEVKKWLRAQITAEWSSEQQKQFESILESIEKIMK